MYQRIITDQVNILHDQKYGNLVGSFYDKPLNFPDVLHVRLISDDHLVMLRAQTRGCLHVWRLKGQSNDFRVSINKVAKIETQQTGDVAIVKKNGVKSLANTKKEIVKAANEIIEDFLNERN